jgi:hypothetical protein
MGNQITISDVQNETALEVKQIGSVRDIVSAKGNVTGQRFTFGGPKTPKEILEHLKAKGHKPGNKLNNMVREIRRGNKSLAWAETQCFLEMCREKDLQTSVGEMRKNTAVLRFVSTKEVVSKAKKAEGLDPEVVIANRMGVKVEELRALYATAKLAK